MSQWVCKEQQGIIYIHAGLMFITSDYNLLYLWIFSYCLSHIGSIKRANKAGDKGQLRRIPFSKQTVCTNCSPPCPLLFCDNWNDCFSPQFLASSLKNVTETVKQSINLICGLNVLYHCRGQPSIPSALFVFSCEIVLSSSAVVVSANSTLVWCSPVEGKSKESKDLSVIGMSGLTGQVYKS